MEFGLEEARRSFSYHGRMREGFYGGSDPEGWSRGGRDGLAGTWYGSLEDLAEDGSGEHDAAARGRIKVCSRSAAASCSCSLGENLNVTVATVSMT